MATPNTTFTVGQVLTAQQQNNFPFGLMGLQTLTTSFTTSAVHTTAQDDGLTLTITEIAGRKYKITATEYPYASGGQQGVQFYIFRSAVQLRQFTFPTNVMNTTVATPVTLSFIYTSVASGSATYKMQFAAQSVNTAVTSYGDGTFPRQFIIEDIGTA